MVAVNDEARGVSAERISTGVYKISGALGLAKKNGHLEIPQDINGHRLCSVDADELSDGTIIVKVSKRKFVIESSMINAGDLMDIPPGRRIDLRLEISDSEAH